jgi:hypothetical protein
MTMWKFEVRDDPPQKQEWAWLRDLYDRRPQHMRPVKPTGMRWQDSPSDWYRTPEVALAAYHVRNDPPGLRAHGALYKGKISNMRAALEKLNLANKDFWRKE